MLQQSLQGSLLLFLLSQAMLQSSVQTRGAVCSLSHCCCRAPQPLPELHFLWTGWTSGISVSWAILEDAFWSLDASVTRVPVSLTEMLRKSEGNYTVAIWLAIWDFQEWNLRNGTFPLSAGAREERSLN